MTDHLQRKWTADLQFLHMIIDSFRELKWNIESQFGGGCLKWDWLHFGVSYARYRVCLL